MAIQDSHSAWPVCMLPKLSRHFAEHTDDTRQKLPVMFVYACKQVSLAKHTHAHNTVQDWPAVIFRHRKNSAHKFNLTLISFGQAAFVHTRAITIRRTCRYGETSLAANSLTAYRCRDFYWAPTATLAVCDHFRPNL